MQKDTTCTARSHRPDILHVQKMDLWEIIHPKGILVHSFCLVLLKFIPLYLCQEHPVVGILFSMGTIDIRKVFGENVKHYRKKAGLSQEQLAEKLDISTNHMSVIETGGKFVTYKLLERIVETFDIMPAALFFMPGTAPFDDTVQNKVNTIIKEELETAGVEIAKRIAKL